MTNYLPKPVQDVIDGLGQLPGIGPKTAQRLAFYLVRNQDGLHLKLGEALTLMRENLGFCQICCNITIVDPCEICASSQREKNSICVVEEPLDVMAIEKTGQYKGLYHVLHGVLSPIDGVGPHDLKIAELKSRLGNDEKEIILALNPSLEGEATAMYIQNALLSYTTVRLTRIARGLPMGGDLEYADPKTLIKALEGRREF